MRSTALVLGLALVAIVSAQTPPTEDEKRLKTLEKNYLAAKAVLAKKPKDKVAQKKFVTAGTLYGHESMVSPVLPARVKYRQALHVYREVLKYEPKQPVARPEYDLIVKIYKQMGRPVPQ
ncbi:hypothetical protein BH11ARM2_BH11ARM2_30570 [soil metagenome]